MKGLENLGWNRWIDQTAQEALSFPAKEQILLLKNSEEWARSVEHARALQAETAEVMALIQKTSLWSGLRDLEDLESILKRLDHRAVLEFSELVLLKRWLEVLDTWVSTPKENLGLKLRQAQSSLWDPGLPLRRLHQVITPKDEFSENASPRYAELSKAIRLQQREMEQKIGMLVQKYADQGILQERLSDVRDGRYVLPVKISDQRKVPGLIYEASVSRQTVFIEPKEMEENSRILRELEGERLQEIYRILSELSDLFFQHVAEMRSSYLLLVHWDAVRAKGRMALRMGGKSIRVGGHEFELSDAAYPLLWGTLPIESIVKNDLKIEESIRTFLITGPNTGGKTVLLKMMGMAACFARTGFSFPAGREPSVPFFDTIFVDVGDSQSVEEHLSSFSGHVLKLKEILDQVTPRSLILLDELNTATDPAEGAALARAFLETIHERYENQNDHPLMVATTHDSQLKRLAFEDSRFLNASMEFDEKEILPTYRLRVGVPGQSRALDIAARLGVPDSVLKMARSYLTREGIEFEAFLKRIDEEVKRAESARKEAERLRNEAEQEKLNWKNKTKEFLESLLPSIRSKLRRNLDQARDEIRQSVKLVKEGRTQDFSLKEIEDKARFEIQKTLDEHLPEWKSEDWVEPQSVVFEVGDRVRVPKWKSYAVIAEIKKDQARVFPIQPSGEPSSMALTLSLSELSPMTPAEKKGFSQKKEGIRVSFNQETPIAGRSLDLRGVRLEEAMQSLEKYIDQSYRAGYAEVTVIHGLGTGALKEGTRKLLTELPYVRTFRDGGPGNGGAGATQVEFER